MKRNNKYVVNGEKENVNIGIFIWRPHSSVATVGITHLFYGFYRLSLRCICSNNNIIPAMNVNVFSINTPFTRVSQLNFIKYKIISLNDDHCKQYDHHHNHYFNKIFIKMRLYSYSSLICITFKLLLLSSSSSFHNRNLKIFALSFKNQYRIG